MKIAQRIREVMQNLDEFTGDDVFQVVQAESPHMYATLGQAVNRQVWLAKQRGEVEEVGVKQIGPKSRVKVWRRVKDITTTRRRLD